MNRNHPTDQFEGQSVLITEALESWALLAHHIPALTPQHLGLDTEMTVASMRKRREDDLIALRRKVVHKWFAVKLRGTSWAKVAQHRDDRLVQQRLRADRNEPVYPSATPTWRTEKDIVERSG